MPEKPDYKAAQQSLNHLNQFRKPKEGMMWNPLLKHPRNEPCPCGSGIKFKRCHLNSMPVILPKQVIDQHIKASIKEAASKAVCPHGVPLETKCDLCP